MDTGGSEWDPPVEVMRCGSQDCRSARTPPTCTLALGSKTTKRGTTRSFRYRFRDEAGVLWEHLFTVVTEPEQTQRQLVDDTIPAPSWRVRDPRAPAQGRDLRRRRDQWGKAVVVAAHAVVHRFPATGQPALTMCVAKQLSCAP